MRIKWKHDWTIIVKIQAGEQYAWTRKTAKRINYINFFLTYHKDQTSVKHVALQNLSIRYYSWKYIRKQYKNNKLKIITPKWNDKSELPDGSCSVLNIQDIKYIIKKHETLTIIPPIHVYVNRTNNRLVFKIKNGYKL